MDRIAFGSGTGAPYNVLSNFFEAPIRLTVDDVRAPGFSSFMSPGYVTWMKRAGNNGVVFPSSEHVWQSLKAANEETFRAFTMGGTLTRMAPDTFKLFFPLSTRRVTKKKKKKEKEPKYKTSYTYWNTRRMVGILAKLAVSPKHMKKMAAEGFYFHTSDKNTSETVPEMQRDEMMVWQRILRLKFFQNPPLAQILRDTGGAVLYESSRLNPGHWAAKVNKETGALEGGNAMGRYMMLVRQLGV